MATPQSVSRIPDVRSLQQTMAKPATSHAQGIVRRLLRSGSGPGHTEKSTRLPANQHAIPCMVYPGHAASVRRTQHTYVSAHTRSHTSHIATSLCSCSGCLASRSFPDVDLPQSDDPHVLRSQVLQLKAKMKEYASKAEAACYEVCCLLPS